MLFLIYYKINIFHKALIFLIIKQSTCTYTLGKSDYLFHTVMVASKRARPFDGKRPLRATDLCHFRNILCMI